MVCETSFGGRVEDLPRLDEGSLFGPNCAKTHYFQSTEVDVLERLPFLFKNLKNLSLAVNFFKMSHMLATFCLLKSAPLIKELDVWGCTEGAKEFEANNEFLNDQLTDDMFVKLHVVRLKNISCVRNEMHFMEFVLSKARLLRKLYVRLSFYAVCSNEEAVVDVTEYPRTSSDAQVIFMGRESESLLNECNAIVDTSTEDTVDEVEETRTNSGLSSDVFPDITAPHQVSKLFLLADGNVALSEERGIDCPEFPDITALHQAILREGDTTDPVSNGAGNAHMFSEEGHLVNHVANVNADSPEGHIHTK
uniref:FBD domain-containing protein n=1 Tax=Oryza punctata TaxID=4537 RepID=A0A0E0LVM8_ORYPU